jgi:hypothetical protein
LYKHRIFSYIDEESVGRPMAHELNEGGSDAMFCEGGGATGLHGLPANVKVEVTAYSGDEEIPCGYLAFGCEPEG